jgi:hypothetical protein
MGFNKVQMTKIICKYCGYRTDFPTSMTPIMGGLADPCCSNWWKNFRNQNEIIQIEKNMSDCDKKWLAGIEKKQ